MPNIVITDEARQYLEMVSAGISQHLQYRGNDLWQADLDIQALSIIAENRLLGESPSDTLIRGVRARLGLKPH
jgi:hypothetical protein